MRQHHVGQRRVRHLARDLRRRPIAQVATTSRDALADRRRIGARAQHPLVVVGFQHEDVEVAERAPKRGARMSEVVRDAHSSAHLVGGDDRHRLLGVVRHGDRL
jgi:hypothetical protein